MAIIMFYFYRILNKINFQSYQYLNEKLLIYLCNFLIEVWILHTKNLKFKISIKYRINFKSKSVTISIPEILCLKMKIMPIKSEVLELWNAVYYIKIYLKQIILTKSGNTTLLSRRGGDLISIRLLISFF